VSLYQKKQRSSVDLQGPVKIAGTQITANASELNRSDFETQTLAADGPITVKNGVCVISKTVPGAVAATLATPTAGDDDFKRLTIINGTAHASTVNAGAGGFGGGGGGEDVATFSGAVGDSLSLIAYNGKWYITGVHQCTIA
jgi:hypothetical protein